MAFVTSMSELNTPFGRGFNLLGMISYQLLVSLEPVLKSWYLHITSRDSSIDGATGGKPYLLARLEVFGPSRSTNRAVWPGF